MPRGRHRRAADTPYPRRLARGMDGVPLLRGNLPGLVSSHRKPKRSRWGWDAWFGARR